MNYLFIYLLRSFKLTRSEKKYIYRPRAGESVIKRIATNLKTWVIEIKIASLRLNNRLVLRICLAESKFSRAVCDMVAWSFSLNGRNLAPWMVHVGERFWIMNDNFLKKAANIGWPYQFRISQTFGCCSYYRLESISLLIVLDLRFYVDYVWEIFHMENIKLRFMPVNHQKSKEKKRKT